MSRKRIRGLIAAGIFGLSFLIAGADDIRCTFDADNDCEFFCFDD